MKGTEQFIRTIAEYPNGRAMTDPLFAPNLQKPYKNNPKYICPSDLREEHEQSRGVCNQNTP